MTTAAATAPTVHPRLAALQAYDRHTCTDRGAGSMPLDDGMHPTVTCRCPEGDRLWQAVLDTPA